MRVVEQYYGPVRRDHHKEYPLTAFSMGLEMECYIRVQVGHRTLHVKNFFHREVPAKVALREAQREIMREVEREVFGA